MVTVLANFPREITPSLPAHARPVGAQPKWARQEWAIEYVFREQADLEILRLRALGASAKIQGD